MASSYTSSTTTNTKTKQQLPLKPIPGSYGLRFFGAIMDHHDFFYHQGHDKFFATRIEEYNSTVFRTNMPRGNFISSNLRVVALLDAASFPILFDNSKVEKRNVLDGTFMPSTPFTGGHRVCAYLDTAEPSHRAIKTFFLNTLLTRKDLFIPLFRRTLSESFIEIEDQLSGKSRTASLNDVVSSASFNFMFRLLCDDKDPSETSVGTQGPKLFDTWLQFQGLPKIFNCIEDFLIRTVPCLTKSGYRDLYEAFSSSAGKLLEEAEKAGIKRSEACHNLIFMAGYNAYGGLKNQLPILMKWVSLGGEKLHREIAGEVRSTVREEGGVITIGALERMSFVKSVVYEALRIEPAVPYQYAKAREDMVVSSHDASFEIKKGEMLFGYQPFATRDSRIFENAGEFVARRFVGEEGEKLLRYVVWSNGPETEEPSPENKQCPGKNLVVLLCRLFLVEFFLRYDTFVSQSKMNAFGVNLTITSLAKASNLQASECNNQNGSFQSEATGSQVSNNNTPGTSSGINLSADNVATELSFYKAACKLDPDLRSFDATLQTRTNQVINTIAVGVEVRSLSFDSLRQVTECLLDMNQDVVKVILDCKKDIWNEKELFELVEEYFDNSLKTLNFYNELQKCLQRARDRQLLVLVALQQFDEETEEVGNSGYARTLQGLKNFKAAGDPFTIEFFQTYQSVYNQQKLMLEKLRLREDKLDKKLKCIHTWRKVSSVIFVVTVAAVFICSVVAAAIASPHVAAALAAASAIPIGSMGTWIDSLLKNYEDALKGQKGVTISAQVRTYVAIKDLENIRVLIDRLEVEIESLMQNVDFAIEQEAVMKVAIEGIKKKLGFFMKNAEDLGVHADKCSDYVMAARKEVLQRIIKLPHN